MSNRSEKEITRINTFDRKNTVLWLGAFTGTLSFILKFYFSIKVLKSGQEYDTPGADLLLVSVVSLALSGVAIVCSLLLLLQKRWRAAALVLTLVIATFCAYTVLDSLLKKQSSEMQHYDHSN